MNITRTRHNVTAHVHCLSCYLVAESCDLYFPPFFVKILNFKIRSSVILRVSTAPVVILDAGVVERDNKSSTTTTSPVRTHFVNRQVNIQLYSS